ncbi:hypothetical protein RSAG8_07240, partial [Rhizoctonia solani AG-8 WAC10335]
MSDYRVLWSTVEVSWCFLHLSLPRTRATQAYSTLPVAQVYILFHSSTTYT